MVRKFSNRYHIGTAVPADNAHWTTFANAVVGNEATLYRTFATGGARIVEAVGYAPGSEVPVFSKVYTTDGSMTPSNWVPIPGDAAAVIRYSTPDRSTKNHPVYCFNYYHAVGGEAGGVYNDACNAHFLTVAATYAAAWITGFSDGTTTFHRSRPTGDLCTGAIVLPLLSHRDLPH